MLTVHRYTRQTPQQGVNKTRNPMISDPSDRKQLDDLFLASDGKVRVDCNIP